MLRKRAALGVACALLAGLTSGLARAEPVDVAIISDGDELTHATRTALVDELRSLSDFETTFRFPATWQTEHRWQVDIARRAMESALADDSVEIVVALDVLSSSLAARFAPEKPLIAAMVIDPVLQGFSTTRSGTGGTPNLHFLSVDFDLAGALRSFQRMTEARHIGLLVDPHILGGATASELFRRAREELDFDLSLIEPSAADLDEPLEFIPPDVDGLFLTPLPRLDPHSYGRLVQLAIDEQWPTFTTLGRADVEAGLLMGKSLVPQPKQVARQLAIDIRDITLGRSGSQLPGVLEVRDRLVFNLSTAKAIGFHPSFELLLSADLVDEEVATDRLLTLNSAVDEALARNLRLAVAQHDLELADQDAQVARGTLLPQLTGKTNWTVQDRDLAGTGPTRTVETSLSFSQSIYSEALRSRYRATVLAQAAQESDLEAIELDVIETAASAYLNVLIAKTEREIQVENLKLTQANIERAQSRYDVGSGDRSEVLRFESELGIARQRVTSAVAAYERLRFELNRVLKQPIELAFQVEESGIDAAKIFGDGRLGQFFQKPDLLRTLSDFLAEEARRKAPELAAIQARIQAQERLLSAAERRRYVPTVSAFSRAGRIVNDSGARFDTDFDTDWSLGLEVGWSLFEGGSIKAEKRRATLQAQQLQLTLQQTADAIETQTRSRLAEAASSRLNIGFAESSAEAARKTLDLVTDAYVRGSVGYIDLIDAQNSHLNARLAAANAVYQHLRNLVALQRSIAFFDFAVSAEEKEAWLDRMDRFTQSRQESQR